MTKDLSFEGFSKLSEKDSSLREAMTRCFETAPSCLSHSFAKEIAVRAGAAESQNQHVTVDPVDQESVRLDMALLVSDPVSRQGMVVALFRQRPVSAAPAQHGEQEAVSLEVLVPHRAARPDQAGLQFEHLSRASQSSAVLPPYGKAGSCV